MQRQFCHFSLTLLPASRGLSGNGQGGPRALRRSSTAASQGFQLLSSLKVGDQPTTCPPGHLLPTTLLPPLLLTL